MVIIIVVRYILVSVFLYSHHNLSLFASHLEGVALIKSLPLIQARASRPRSALLRWKNKPLRGRKSQGKETNQRPALSHGRKVGEEAGAIKSEAHSLL